MSIVLNNPVAPDLTKLTRYLERVNESGWYTNFGPLHEELTLRLEEYLGVKNLLLVSNGTFALQVAYKVLGISKAVTTPYSFVATSSSLIWQNIQTTYADIDKKSYNLSPNEAELALKRDASINGIVATHVYGNPCDVNAFCTLHEKYNAKVVYDAAHAFGVKIGGRSVLSYGDASTLSFHATKIFHTVEGGAIVFKHRKDYEKAKKLINFGLDNGHIEDIGINAKLNEYQCAVGLSLLDEIDNILEHRAELFCSYKKILEGAAEIPRWHSDSNYNGAYFPIVLKDEDEKHKVKSQLEVRGIQSRDYFSPSLNLVFMPDESMPISEDIASRVLCLPLHFNMSLSDVEEVCCAVLLGIKT